MVPTGEVNTLSVNNDGRTLRNDVEAGAAAAAPIAHVTANHSDTSAPPVQSALRPSLRAAR
jgi:hypothetical protein